MSSITLNISYILNEHSVLHLCIYVLIISNKQYNNSN